MNVLNIHQRALSAPPEQVGRLLDSLSSDSDLLWPRTLWPRMKFDRSLQVGATGGHGPIRYTVEAYQPGQSIRFRFTGPAGFNGHHGFHAESNGESGLILRNVLKMKISGRALLTWPLLYRPLHDALIEDSLARAQSAVGEEPDVRPWSLWVRFLRRVLGGRRTESGKPSGS